MSARRRSALAALVAAPIALGSLPALAGPAPAAASAPSADSATPVPGSAFGAWESATVKPVSGSDARATPRTTVPEPAAVRTGLSVPAPGATAGAAALAYASGNHRGRGDLQILSESTDELGTVVRLAQRVDGIPVLGGQYVVRLDGRPGSYVVRGTTDGTATALPPAGAAGATVPTATLERVFTQMAQRRYPAERISVKAGELVIVPIGSGVLTRRMSLTVGRSGEVRDVYLGASTGSVVLDLTRRKEIDVTSTERTLHGAQVRVHADKSGGQYALTDVTRAPRGPAIVGKRVTEDGAWVPITQARLPFGADETQRGSIDAHLDVAATADYYQKVLGRNGIDGQGGDLIHVTGEQMVNAYWDGGQMVIGLGDDEYLPLSADVDVVGHEMTHGVIDHTAGFIYQSQSGAMHEAYADYFGNAVDNGQSAAAMGTPGTGLLGENLCRTLAPGKCALRNLDDGRTVKDYTGTLVDLGGVHLNATIFGGALWDIRQALDPTLADKVIYRGLSAYLGPWATFTDAREATLAAAKELKLTAAQQAVIVKAFDVRGIVRGWEMKAPTDADRVLMSDLPAFSDWNPPVAGGGRWAIDTLDPVTGSFFTGRTDGTAAEWVEVPDGQRVIELATDGRYVAATTTDWVTMRLWLYDTTTKKGAWVAQDDMAHFYAYPSLAGGRLAWQDSYDSSDGPDAMINVATIGSGQIRRLESAGESAAHLPSLSARTLAHVEGPRTRKDLVVRDAATLKVVARKRVVDSDLDTTWRPVALNDKVVWTFVDWHREWPNGPKVTAYVSPRTLTSKRVLNEIALPTPWYAELTLQATESAMTQIRPKSLLTFHREVIQKPLAGGTAVPVTCDKGGAYLFHVDEGKAVVWLSGAQGKIDLVMRKTPAGPC